MVSVTQKNNVYCIIVENPNRKELAIVGELQRLQDGAQSEWEYWSLGKPHTREGNAMDDAFEAYRPKTEYERIKEEDIPFIDNGSRKDMGEPKQMEIGDIQFVDRRGRKI